MTRMQQGQTNDQSYSALCLFARMPSALRKPTRNKPGAKVHKGAAPVRGRWTATRQ